MKISGSQGNSSCRRSSSSTGIIGTEYRIGSIKGCNYVVRYSIRIRSKISSNSSSDISGHYSLSCWCYYPSIYGTTHCRKVTHCSVSDSDITSSKGSSSISKCSSNYKTCSTKIRTHRRRKCYTQSSSIDINRISRS